MRPCVCARMYSHGVIVFNYAVLHPRGEHFQTQTDSHNNHVSSLKAQASTHKPTRGTQEDEEMKEEEKEEMRNRTRTVEEEKVKK